MTTRRPSSSPLPGKATSSSDSSSRPSDSKPKKRAPKRSVSKPQVGYLLPATAASPPRSPSPSSSTSTSSSLTQSPVRPVSELDTPAPDAGLSPQVTRHPDLWFRDGSVVLHAGDILFRVHISQLSRHSLFFRDMFSLPQPEETVFNENSECPVLPLSDSPVDVANLLKALYDGPFFGRNDRADFAVVAGILRLSTKYIVDGLRMKALEHIAVAWPSTLKSWDAREDHAHSILELDATSHGGLAYPSPIEVINLAREVDAPELLAAAFYDLSRYHYTQIFELSDDEPLHVPTGLRGAPGQTLGADDLRRLALGKEASHQAVVGLVQSMGRHSLQAPTASFAMHARTSSGAQGSRRRLCLSPAACRKEFGELVDLATQHYLLERERGSTDPLYVAEELGQLKSTEHSECRACAHNLEAWAQRERERMWKLIPLWFRLES